MTPLQHTFSRDECLALADGEIPTLAMNHLLHALADAQYCILDACLADEVIAALRDTALMRDATGVTQPAGVGKTALTRPQLRGDRIAWLSAEDQTPAIQAYLLLMEAIRMQVNRGLMMGVQQFESHFAVYPAHSVGYRTHIDQLRQINGQAHAGIRRLSSVLYLNSDWPADAGGQLKLYLDPSETAPSADARALEIAPIGGRLVLFCADRFWHEVLPARQARASVTGWFKTLAQEVMW